jgi:hypothetical protein
MRVGISRRGTGVGPLLGLTMLLELCLVIGAGQASAQEFSSRRAHRMARPAGKPAYVWLWYGDGVTQPTDDGACTGYKTPAFRCSYGATIEDCQRQVQSILDVWYADFNVVFSLTRPPTGDYITIVITSDNGWCSVPGTESANSTVAGYAQCNCNDNTLVVGYAFDCGTTALTCATVIAHEHAHWVGLEHTTSTTDVMNRYVLATAAGFDDKDNVTVNDSCNRESQNSYQMMLSAFGPWSGNVKPSPFSAVPDAGARDLAADMASQDAADAHSPADAALPADAGIDTGPISVLPGFDAIPRPPLPTVEAGASGGGGSHGGCNLGGSGRPGTLVLPALLFAVFAALTRRGRRAPRADARPPCAGPPR